MNNREKIIEFQNINIKDYLNKVHKTSDNFLIETQKHNLKKYMEELNTELYKGFINNSDGLLKILNTYDYCYNLLNDFNIPRTSHSQNTIDTVLFICKEFEKKIKRFEDDLTPYLTGKRYLITSGHFTDNKYYCILTNDLLFLGERIPNSKQYKLLHIFSKNVIHLTLTSSYLELSVQKNKFILTGTSEELQEFYDLFFDIKLEDSEVSLNENELNMELIEYYIITEQIDKLANYIKPIKKVNVNIKKIIFYDESILKQILDISIDPYKTFLEFITNLFKIGLGKINKIQPLNILINEIFDYLYCLVDEINKILIKIELKPYWINLIIHDCIIIIFNTLEKRIFNKFYELKITNNNLKLIETKLVWKHYNFHYMFQTLLTQKKDFSLRCLEIAKKEITKLLNSFCYKFYIYIYIFIIFNYFNIIIINNSINFTNFINRY